ncbi:L,D-transpeptidase [Rhodoplanes sp. TEM]|uniref:L,D-transpeptidase n=1 Tax=Rhodoplanes tepidamans TaxID=200616 RepID=A0ABT5J8J8_RHOTP|nr:L,D-transpeptidase [Rhodoplanes tepidamans]MDC7785721.1 L,D-transpeptidase [Rhodoplanes tepidamans]MDC7987213.1 L,D-transpeptidase [Rhodoplanes sp. TEM]MDQ0358670.1 lipoprotein-anchoring transpeptidase ErfK/SrfK [Rhodoplanes tepidamans]
MTDTTCNEVLRACGRTGSIGSSALYGLSAIALGTALSVLSVGTADASYYYYYGQPGMRAPAGYYAPAQPRPARKAKRTKTEQPKKDVAAARQPRGPLVVSVSIGEQRVRVYDAVGQIAESPISSGTKQHPTLTGVFSVIQKNRYHYSNLYANAPMPYMQRLTWSGTAMHTGALPGYPASHGCIRLPNSFASQLWGLTKLGTRVVVARTAVVPAEFSHPQLDLLKKKVEPAVPVADLRTSGKTAAAAETTVSDAPSPTAPAAEAVAPAETAPAADPAADPAGAAPATAAPAPASPVADAPAKPLKPGPVAIFISKKEGKLFVRKGFEPIYETPVTIADGDKLLGTHVFTATGFEDDGRSLRWTAMTLPPELRAEPKAAKGRNAKAAPAPATPVTATPTSAKEALDRVTLPPEAVAMLADLMSPGASLVVSDKGLGPQTGRGTDFIVLSR